MSTESATEVNAWGLFLRGCEEARRRGDRKVGTEHLLLGLLHEDAMVRVLGFDLAAARAALDGLDRDALSAIGVGAYPEPSATLVSRPRHPGLREVLRDRMPMTATAKRLLEDASRGHAVAIRSRRSGCCSRSATSSPRTPPPTCSTTLGWTAAGCGPPWPNRRRAEGSPSAGSPVGAIPREGLNPSPGTFVLSQDIVDACLSQ